MCNPRYTFAATLLTSALLALALLGCGGGDSDEPSSTGEEPSAADPGTTGVDGSTANGEKPEETKVWLTTGEQLKPVERELGSKGSEVEAAADALVEGPTPISETRLSARRSTPASARSHTR